MYYDRYSPPPASSSPPPYIDSSPPPSPSQHTSFLSHLTKSSDDAYEAHFIDPLSGLQKTVGVTRPSESSDLKGKKRELEEDDSELEEAERLFSPSSKSVSAKKKTKHTRYNSQPGDLSSFTGPGLLDLVHKTDEEMWRETEDVWEKIVDDAFYDGPTAIIDLSGSRARMLTHISTRISDLAKITSLGSKSEYTHASSHLLHTTATSSTGTTTTTSSLRDGALSRGRGATGTTAGNDKQHKYSFQRVSTAPPSSAPGGGRLFSRTVSLGARKEEEVHLLLANNRISTLPRELFCLKKLTVLSLRGNNLTHIPPQIALLTNLRELNLASNSLTCLPAELSTMTLRELHVFPNSFIKQPPPPPRPQLDFSDAGGSYGGAAGLAMTTPTKARPFPGRGVAGVGIGGSVSADNTPRRVGSGGVGVQDLFGGTTGRGRRDSQLGYQSTKAQNLLSELCLRVLFSPAPTPALTVASASLLPPASPTTSATKPSISHAATHTHLHTYIKSNIEAHHSLPLPAQWNVPENLRADLEACYFAYDADRPERAGRCVSEDHTVLSMEAGSSRKDDAGGVVRKGGSDQEKDGDAVSLDGAEKPHSDAGRKARMRPDGRSYCSSPLHHPHPHADAISKPDTHTSGPVFFRPLEERITWERTVAGVSIGGEVPLLWRGCSYGCLEYLATDGAGATVSRSARSSLDADRGDGPSRFDSPGWGRLPSISTGIVPPGPTRPGRSGPAGLDNEDVDEERDIARALLAPGSSPEPPIPRPLFGPGGRRAGYGSDEDDDESMEGSFTDSDVFSGED